jgi:hypothetical protein
MEKNMNRMVLRGGGGGGGTPNQIKNITFGLGLGIVIIK